MPLEDRLFKRTKVKDETVARAEGIKPSGKKDDDFGSIPNTYNTEKS
jgi:hypothetical protein